MKNDSKCFLRFWALLLSSVLFGYLNLYAAERTVAMLPDENWWGLGSAFGRRMPFNAGSDFKCDLRVSNYANPAASLLLSDRGRVIWCAEPVEATIGDAQIRLVSDRGEIVLAEVPGATLAEAFRFASKTYFPVSGEVPELLYFSAPQYNTWIELTYHQNEKDILAYAQSMIDHGLPPGVFMIDDTWQLGYGVWEFDPRRFNDPKGMVEKLHARGFKVLLWMCPFVSMDSPAFRLMEHGKSPDTCVPQPRGGFHLQPGRHKAKPVEWWNGVSALLDFSHPNASGWFRKELDRLRRDYGVDGFKFDGGTFANYLKLDSHDKALSPAGRSALYGAFAVEYPGSEYRNAWGLAGKPLVVRLFDKDHSWDELKKLVPDMLATGLIGYPFVCPDMVGGGSWTSFLPGSPFSQELFVRSAQVQALSPMMQISASPWRVLDAEHQAAFLAAVRLRQKFAADIVALAKRAAKDGEPMMRSLEYAYPGRGYAKIMDEFLMGENLLVAPVVEKGATSRKVVIPPGRWLGDDGVEVEGPAEIVVNAPLKRLPYFKRISE
jgi:alpha-glucosidase